MKRINYTQKGSIIDTDKAIRVALMPLSNKDNVPTINGLEKRTRKFIWIPRSAIVEIDQYFILVKDWYIEINKDIQKIIAENQDLNIVEIM